jgi:hypothetical protein
MGAVHIARYLRTLEEWWAACTVVKAGRMALLTKQLRVTANKGGYQ